MARAHGTSLIAHLVIAAAAVAASVARADIDASGNWLVTITDLGNLQFTEHWVQAGAVLVIDGDTGTIDPQTGAFYIALPTNPMDPCSGGSISGTVASDGQTFTAAFGVCGDTPTLCCALHPGGGVSFNAVGVRIPDNCGNGIVDPGEQCDDGNNVNGDGCDAFCHIEPCYVCSGQPSTCAPAPRGSACDDNPCATNVCDGSGACTGVRSCRSAETSMLLVKASTTAGKDQLNWKWIKGAATTLTDLGVPTGTTNYALCVYAGTVATINLPAGSKWHAAGMSGFSYMDSTGTPNGAQLALLKSGAAGKAKALVKGKGANLPDTLAPPLTLPVAVQLVNDTNNVCLESVFNTSNLINNDSKHFKAKTP